MSDSATPADPDVPALAVLLGAQATPLLEAVFEPAGGRLRSSSISQVRYVPGRSVTVQFRADVIWGSGRPTRELIVATSGFEVPGDVPVFAADSMEIAVWRYPNDPFLPGLAIAADPERAEGLLAQVGAPAGPVSVRTRAYRASRRAVLELTTPGVTLFVKTVRPERAAALQAKHTDLAAHVPVPHSFGWSADHGIVVLEGMPGRTLRKSLEARSKRIPDADALIGVLDGFAEVPPSGNPVADPRRRAAEHARLLGAVHPDLRTRIDGVVESVQAEPAPPEMTVHGDFHASQIMTSNAAIVGVLDVDTAGPGRRINDLANLLGHLSTLSTRSPAKRDLERYGAALIAAFDRVVDPGELRLAIAGVVLGLATGPFRVQARRWRDDMEARVALAEQWVASSRAAR